MTKAKAYSARSVAKRTIAIRGDVMDFQGPYPNDEYIFIMIDR